MIIYHLNLLDTTVATDNLGDLIIYDSIVNEISHILDKIYVTRAATHDNIGEIGRGLIKKSPISLMLGTNVLSSKYKVNRSDMWRLTSKDVSSLKGRVLLCGTGWRKYCEKVGFRQCRFYKKYSTHLSFMLFEMVIHLKC